LPIHPLSSKRQLTDIIMPAISLPHRLFMSLRSPTTRALAALSVTQLIGWGATFYLPAVTGPAMAADLDIALPLIMAGPTVMLVVMAMLSWPLGTLFEQRGARPIMTLGSLIGSAGLLIMGLATGPVAYLLAWIFLGLGGACMLTTPAQIAVTEIAGEQARKALSILILAGGLTSTIIWPLTGLLQAQWGWRATTVLYAALMLAVCMPLHVLTLARRPAGKSANKTSSELSRSICRASSFSPQVLPPTASSPGVLP
jgi:MFS family permease